MQERQNLPCTYLAQHELKSVLLDNHINIIIIIIVITMLVIVIIIIIIIIIIDNLSVSGNTQE